MIPGQVPRKKNCEYNYYTDYPNIFSLKKISPDSMQTGYFSWNGRSYSHNFTKISGS